MVFHVSIPLDQLKFVVSLPLNIFLLSFLKCNTRKKGEKENCLYKQLLGVDKRLEIVMAKRPIVSSTGILHVPHYVRTFNLGVSIILNQSTGGGRAPIRPLLIKNSDF